MKNPGSNYVHNGSKSKNQPHNIKHEDVNQAFRRWGIIGKRRYPVTYIRPLPVVERGSCSSGKA